MTTIERMAQAMFDADSKENGLSRDWQFESGCHATYRAMARAALQAIRVPDDGMLEAGQQNPSVEGRPLWKCTTDVQAAVRFTAMIDAILEEKPE